MDEASWQVPKYRLAGATTYYARVTAIDGDVTAVSPVSSFTTVEVIPPVPVLITPEVDGMALYSRDVVAVEPVEGAASLRVQISASETFPTRSSYNGTINDGFETIALSAIGGAGKLVDGKTYYTRARYAYRTLATGTTMQYTDYCDVRTFVYHATVQGDVNGDGEVNIADVNAVIDLVIAGGGMGHPLADVNEDAEVNLADVNAIIDMILNPRR